MVYQKEVHMNQPQMIETVEEFKPPTATVRIGMEMGSDADHKARAERRHLWAVLSEQEKAENTTVKKAAVMREGFHAGFEAAASDFVNGTATVEHFETIRSVRDVTDAYAMGFELGYFRKLAEILVA